jgi:lysozyme family protein
MTAFQRSMPRVLAHEGGKVDDPEDPGGRTNQGVTQRVYDAYRVRIGARKRDVYDMDAAERDAIYKDQYWNAVRGDDLPAGLDYVVFDGAVNSGPSRSIKWLQQALGVEIDGHIGSITLAAAQAHPIPELIDKICAIRMAFLKKLKHWPKFGRGWTSRVDGVRKVGKGWANKEPVSVAPAKPTPKATQPKRSWIDILFRRA